MPSAILLGRRYFDESLLAYASLLLACQLLQGCHSTLHSSPHHTGPRMHCGDGVSLCGVLVLQSGFGHAHYRHRQPHVHGLWPETGKFGDSRCALPRGSETPPHYVHSCYQHAGEGQSNLLHFQSHEWTKHGRCAGVDSASDYFKQICTMSAEPLQLMAATRASGGSLEDMASALTHAGYPVWRTEPKTGELLLSACAADGQWKLSDTAAFAQTCGVPYKASAPQRQKSLPDIPAVRGSEICVSGQHGPRCTDDADCGGIPGCLRCAHSGFCTSVSLSSFRAQMRHK